MLKRRRAGSHAQRVRQNRKRRIVRFVYMSHHRDGRFIWPHCQRDESPALELMPLLGSMGYSYEGPGRILLNRPPNQSGDASLDELAVRQLQEDDLLLLATRPPLDERPAPPSGSVDNKWSKKPLRQSGSALERLIVDALKPCCFTRCSRSIVDVDGLRRHFRIEFLDRSKITFSTRADPQTLATGTYLKVGDVKGSTTRPWNHMMTAGYLVHVRLGPGYPRLLALFGMSGTNTLAWSYLIAQNPDLLRTAIAKPTFTMVEIQTTPIAHKAVDFMFCHDWKYDVVAHGPI